MSGLQESEHSQMIGGCFWISHIDFREEERANTEREKARADSLEEKVRELEAIIGKMENH